MKVRRTCRLECVMYARRLVKDGEVLPWLTSRFGLDVTQAVFRGVVVLRLVLEWGSKEL